MQLCKLLGIVDRPTLYAVLTHKAYSEWLELWNCDPWDEDRADLRAGIVASAAVSPYAKKGMVPKPIDFMPYAKIRKLAPRKQSTEEMKKTWAGITKMMRRKRGDDNG